MLDCTLRDGGFALEGEKKNDISYAEEDRAGIVQSLTAGMVDIIELGTIEMGDDDKRGFSIFHKMEELSEMIPKNAHANQIYAVFFRGPDIPLEGLPDWNEQLCHFVRLGVRYSEMEKSLEYCQRLCEKGYLVSVQPIVTMRYTDEELDKVIKAANEMNAYSVYFVDSYGSMFTDDVFRIFQRYDEGLKPDIKIGFHAHNNMGLAFSNVRDMLSTAGDRDIIIDSCCMGMGQGAGNLQTEVLTAYLNKKFNKDYGFVEILKACDYVARFWNDNLWGYSVAAMIPAVYGVAYKYGLNLRNKYGCTYEQIANILQDIPSEMKYRYTESNLKNLLQG